MDDSLLAEFQSTFLIGGEVSDSRGPHPHYSHYKSKKQSYGDPEARRKKFLAEQQNKRRDFADHARRLAEGEELLVETDEEMDEGEEMDEVDSSLSEREKAERRRLRRKKYPYRNQLMLSEWLVDIPQDFEEKWLVVLAPIGQRSLIISAKKTTYAYSREGAAINNFPSLLPGGCKYSHKTASDYCILDCVRVSQSYYILDIMCWGGLPVYDCDLEFRTFWKAQKHRENEKISTYSKVNPLLFHNLDYYPCTRESLSTLLSRKPPYQVDGLLFIHKECRYITGRTPLALWLKPQMVTDILGIPVSQEFLDCSPSLESFKRVKMDTSDGAKESRKAQTKKEQMDTSGEAENKTADTTTSEISKNEMDTTKVVQ